MYTYIHTYKHTYIVDCGVQVDLLTMKKSLHS